MVAVGNVQPWWEKASRENLHRIASAAGEHGLDEADCSPKGQAPAQLCGEFSDPNFDRTRPSYYYGRVVQAPTCRWSWSQCVALPEDERPSECDNGFPKSLNELAWTSPIWIQPEAL